MLDVGGGLTFRGELYLQIGDLALAEVDAHAEGDPGSGGWPLGDAFATAWLAEVLVARASWTRPPPIRGGPVLRPAAEPGVYP